LSNEPLSPCISVCQLDPRTRICNGCLRTIDEIAAWGQLDAPARHEVLARVRERRAAVESGGPAGDDDR